MKYVVIEVWNTEEVSHGDFVDEEAALDYLHSNPRSLRDDLAAKCLYIREVE